jgi:hypothetical protein
MKEEETRAKHLTLLKFIILRLRAARSKNALTALAHLRAQTRLEHSYRANFGTNLCD